MKVDKQQIELVCLSEPEVLQLLTFIKIKQRDVDIYMVNTKNGEKIYNMQKHKFYVVFMLINFRIVILWNVSFAKLPYVYICLRNFR